MTKDNTLVTKTTNDLRKRLKGLLRNAVDNLLEISCVMAEMVDRGVHVPESRMGAFRWFRKIARGELTPEAALAFAESEKLILKMAEFPLDEQRKYARGEPVMLAEFTDTGTIEARDRKLSELTTRQIDLAFGNGAVRPFDVQKRILRSASVGKTDVRRSTAPVSVRADLDTGEIVIGQLRVDSVQVAAALRKLGYRVERSSAPMSEIMGTYIAYDIKPPTFGAPEAAR